MKPNVTIITDASYCPRTHCAGWAAWMVSDTQRSHIEGGQLKGTIEGSNVAELYAINNGIYVALRRGFISEHDRVLIQSDSTHALTAILYKLNAYSQDYKASDGLSIKVQNICLRSCEEAALSWLTTKVEGMGLTLLLRHIKGHKSGDGRFWVNRRCDSLAAKYMNEARRKREPQLNFGANT